MLLSSLSFTFNGLHQQLQLDNVLVVSRVKRAVDWSTIKMEEPALPLGVSYYTKYSSTDTLLNSMTSKSRGCPSRQALQSESSKHSSLSQRLRRRKDLLYQRKRIVDISFAFSVTGS